jgi:hypothetical protein
MPANDTGGSPVDVLPASFPLVDASSKDGATVGGSNLTLLHQVWPDLFLRLGPGLAHRFVEADGRLWRLSWQLDLDSIGALSAATPSSRP